MLSFIKNILKVLFFTYIRQTYWKWWKQIKTINIFKRINPCLWSAAAMQLKRASDILFIFFLHWHSRVNWKRKFRIIYLFLRDFSHNVEFSVRISDFLDWNLVIDEAFNGFRDINNFNVARMDCKLFAKKNKACIETYTLRLYFEYFAREYINFCPCCTEF